MANLTLSIDDETLRRARIRAIELDTSVNSLVRTYLEEFVVDEREEEARRELVELARTSTASSGPEGRAWTRDELYEDSL